MTTPSLRPAEPAATVRKVHHGGEEAPTKSFRSCGVRIDAMPLEQAAAALAAGSVHGAVHLCNAYTLSLATKDPDLSRVLDQSALNLADGMPLVWISKRLGIEDLQERCYGPDLMQRTLELGQGHGTRHYLFGATPEVLAALNRVIVERWPNAVIVGSDAPPFSDDPADFEHAVDRIVESQATIVWVGLGTPKQDVVAQRLAERCDAAFVAVGAAFDFIAGTKKQAPTWVQDKGLEWAYRFATEPRRLWKRYLIGNTRFVVDNVRRRPRIEPAGDAVR